MLIFNGLSAIFLLLSHFFVINTLAQDGTDCITPKDTRGYCMNILRCQQLLDMLHNTSNDPDALMYLQSSTCGYEGIYPMVCCPPTDGSVSTSTTSSTTTPTPVPNPTPASTSPPQQRYTLPRTPSCGVSNSSSSRVVNGEPAKLGEFPWIAALGYRNPKTPGVPRWLCGGTLITEKHILTAGHCVYNRQDLYIARLGELDLDSDADGASPIDVPIERIKLHEEYNPTSITNDIAILTLSQPAIGPMIRPICMLLDEPLRSQNFVRYYPFVAGWGAVYFEGPASSRLQVVMLPVVSNEQCKSAFANFRTTVIDDRVMCAGYASGGRDACQGDSGGPLMLARGNDPHTFYQLGVVSYGFRCAEVGFPGVYTRVTYFLDWIERNVN